MCRQKRDEKGNWQRYRMRKCYGLYHLFYIILFHSATVHWGPGPTTNCWPLVHLSADIMVSHLASLRTTCGQHIASPNHCWVFRLVLPLRISSYQIPQMLGWHRLQILAKNSPTGEWTSVAFLSTSSKQYILYLCG